MVITRIMVEGEDVSLARNVSRGSPVTRGPLPGCQRGLLLGLINIIQ